MTKKLLKTKKKIIFAYVNENAGGLPHDPEYLGRGGICESSELLEDLLKKLRLDERLKNCRVRELWPTLVGEYLAMRSYPDALSRGRLIVRVCDSATLHHLSVLKPHILLNLNKNCEFKIKDIRFCY